MDFPSLFLYSFKLNIWNRKIASVSKWEGESRELSVSVFLLLLLFNLAPMRIRKRQVHLSSSSFSPLHLSDPHLVNRSPVVVQLNDATHNTTSVLSQHVEETAAPTSLDRYQPSDQTLQLTGKLPSNGCDDVSGIGESGAHKQLNKQHPLVI